MRENGCPIARSVPICATVGLSIAALTVWTSAASGCVVERNGVKAKTITTDGRTGTIAARMDIRAALTSVFGNASTQQSAITAQKKAG